jgi:hypothetical protein
MTAKPFQARLMLYEKSEPYLQSEAVQKTPPQDAKSKSNDSTGK